MLCHSPAYVQHQTDWSGGCSVIRRGSGATTRSRGATRSWITNHGIRRLGRTGSLIAIVRIDAAGRELGVYETLVNPVGRRVRSAYIRSRQRHGGTGAHLREIASSVLAWLEAVVVVAHRMRFSARSSRELVSLPRLSLRWTPAAGASFVPTPNHRLATVRALRAGVTIDGPYTALGDARATAQVLPRLLATRRAVPTVAARVFTAGGVMGGGLFAAGDR